jgi:ribosomal protein S18 acetylase RimI-like enzyme
MANFTVRGFRREDAGDIFRLHQQANQWFEELPIDEEFVVQVSLRPDFRFFLAEFDGDVVGFAGVLFYEHVGRAELGPICVHEKYRDMGVGSLLVEEALKFLGERKIHRVVARVKSGNKKAQLFFKVNGFGWEAVLKKYTKKGEEVVQMVRFL